MVVATPPFVPGSIPVSHLKRITAAKYDRMVEAGIFTPDDRIELIEGYLVDKMGQNEPHAYAIARLMKLLIIHLKSPWELRVQAPVLLSGDSVPEPDLAVVRGPLRRYLTTNRPTAPDIGLIIEVSDSTLDQDRGIKQKIYARDHIPQYWVVNLVDKIVEVYTQPRAGKSPGYRQTVSYSPGSSVPLKIDDIDMGLLAVSEFMP
jgi:Uma2 family endonuclease